MGGPGDALPTLPVHEPATGAQRTVLELIAEVMEAGFDALGQGVVLGTMPAYLEDFGQRNARYLAARYVTSDTGKGAVAALGPLNLVSRVTGTPYTLPQATADRAVKRLGDCEFLDAFQGRDPFARAMVCRLHEAVYRGSVNGLLDDPDREGYDVQLRSRILFGDPHCDFEVQSRLDRPATQQAEQGPATLPSERDAEEETLHFYIAILTAFVEYLHEVLPGPRVHGLLTESARRVGGKVGTLLQETGDLDATLQAMFRHSGRETDREDGSIIVSSCPFVRPIRGATSRLEETRRQAVQEAACLSCTQVASGCAGPGATVERESSLIVDGAPCRFTVRQVGG